MFGAAIVACLLMVATGPRVCHSQNCLDSQGGRTYNRVLVSEGAMTCMDGGTGVDLVASSKCECAQQTEEADLNTFRYSEDGCRAIKAVPVAGEGGGRSESETVEVYVAAEPSGDTALPPDDGPTVTGLNLNIVDYSASVAEWDGVGDYSCRAVSGYRVQFDEEVVVTTNLSATVRGKIDPVCDDGPYWVTVTAQDENGNDFGTPASASADLPPAYKLECCSPPFVMSDVGCVYPVWCTMDFDDAREVCKSYGTDFFTSATVEETNIFKNVVEQLLSGDTFTWVGVQKAGNDYAWSTSGRLVDAAEWKTEGIQTCPLTSFNDVPQDCGYVLPSQIGPVCNTGCENSASFVCSAPTLNPCESGLP